MNTETQQHLRRGYIFAICAAALFSTKPILIKWAYQYGIDPTSLLALRMGFAMPVYVILGITLLRRSTPALSAKEWAGAALVGIAGYYLASYFDLQGLKLANAQLERIILYAYPTMVVILGALIFGNKISRNQWIAMVLCYAGILSIFIKDLSLQGEQVIAGAGLILISALTFAFYMLFSKGYIDKLGSLLFTCVAMASASLAIGIHAGIESVVNPPAPFELGMELLGIILLLTFGATIIPSFMTSEAVKHIGAANAALTGTLGPLMTSLMAVIFLDEVFTWMHAVGMLLVVFGIRQLGKK